MYQSQDKFQMYKLHQTCEWISKLLKVLEILFRFQWQMEKLWFEVGLGPGFSSISP